MCLFHPDALTWQCSGNVIGYHVTQPCEVCLDSCNNGHFWMFCESVRIKFVGLTLFLQLVSEGVKSKDREHFSTYPGASFVF
ncbi:hypothetical protein BC830DRAFT_1091257, partial [Chytriomyces sp. MP71]